ncbi:MAG: GNAT family N-acetyltransferase [Pseudomonadota bacterium]
MEKIAAMTLEELELVLDWAAAEGWNPGLADAAAFHAADPEGFLLKTVNGQPAAAISVVNHSPDFAFLGLYIAAPEFRGQGHGWDVWQAGLARAGNRTIGLDGVPAQQANYARSGFAPSGRTIRYSGRMPSEAPEKLRGLSERDLPTLLRQDARTHGVSRARFLEPWLRGTECRRTAVVEEADHLAFATVRRCRAGLKIGPLVAKTDDAARALLGGLSDGTDVLVDVPETSTQLVDLLEQAGFSPVFETARMYLGPPPPSVPPRLHAVATLELG